MGIDPTRQRIRNLEQTNKLGNPHRGGAKKNFSEILTASLKSDKAIPEAIKNNPTEYIVKPGDNLWKIGKDLFDKSPCQIARDNGISNPNKIYPGQKLKIFQTQPSPVRETAAGNEVKEITATWYGREHHNKITANGERFNMYKNTVAHRTLPFGTKLRLVNPENGKAAVGIVNDRGPYIQGRDLDISYALAKQLGFLKKGVTKLQIEII